MGYQWINRPWGRYKTIWRNKKALLKIIEVKPNSKLSLQYHEHRDEYWILLDGHGEASIDMSTYSLKYINTRMFIQRGSRHRIINTSKVKKLVIEELQIGKCRESDIIRLEDIYGRV